ncbi:hypothetical protein BH10PSE18_BH10PSE18_12570 [soil metagenome]
MRGDYHRPVVTFTLLILSANDAQFLWITL